MTHDSDRDTADADVVVRGNEEHHDQHDDSPAVNATGANDINDNAAAVAAPEAAVEVAGLVAEGDEEVAMAGVSEDVVHMIADPPPQQQQQQSPQQLEQQSPPQHDQQQQSGIESLPMDLTDIDAPDQLNRTGNDAA